MTGFGKAECDLQNKKVSIEIKSLNSKQLDVHSKIPGLYKEKDLEIRNMISKNLERGKVEVYISYEILGSETTGAINKDVFKHYYKQLQEVTQELNIAEADSIIPTIMRLPDTMQIERPALSDDEWINIKDAIQTAIKTLNEFRTQEGKSLETDIRLRCSNISSLLKEVKQFEESRIQYVKKKIKDSLQELTDVNSIDQNRFEQELIYYIEKLDITEEKVRLTNHCDYFLSTIETDCPNGKKLGFIVQEMGREINTLGSKANDSNIQKIVVQMKDELEKIKEQVLNIL